MQALYQVLVGRNEPAAVDAFTRDLVGFHKADSAHYDALLHGCAEQAAELDALLSAHGLTRDDVTEFLYHPGGPKVLQAYADAYGIEAARFRWSRDVLAATPAAIVQTLSDAIAAAARAPDIAKRFEQDGVESDDLLAAEAVARARAGEEVLIVSSDKDFAQIVNDRIRIMLPPPSANPKLGWRLLDAAGVAHKDGHIAEDATPPFCDETTTKKAVEMVRAQFGDACEHYLKTITTYNAASWPGIEQLVVLNP
mgnify:CR=1 FL=1